MADGASAEPTSGWAEVNGLRLHYLDWGTADATPLVLLHGLGGTAAEWRPIAEHFRSRYHVLALDQRGHGESSPGAGYATDDFVADLEGFVDALHLDRFILCGHSMGGHHTLAYLSRHPERVVCALVNDMPPAYEPRRTNEPPVTYESVEAWMAEARASNPLTPEPMLRLRAEARLRPAEGGFALKADPNVLRGWAPRDLWDEVKTISRPVLFIRGGRSTVLDAQTLMDMDMAVGPARSITLEQAGHTTFFDMQPEWLAATQQFFSAHANRLEAAEPAG